MAHPTYLQASATAPAGHLISCQEASVQKGQTAKARRLTLAAACCTWTILSCLASLSAAAMPGLASVSTSVQAVRSMNHPPS